MNYGLMLDQHLAQATIFAVYPSGVSAPTPRSRVTRIGRSLQHKATLGQSEDIRVHPKEPTPDEHICKIGASDRDRAIFHPIHPMPGLNS